MSDFEGSAPAHAWNVLSADNLLLCPVAEMIRHPEGMAHIPGSERYRVRKVHQRERSVPDEVEAPLFACVVAADQYARSLHQKADQRVIVEKRAAAGCWLTLAEYN